MCLLLLLSVAWAGSTAGVGLTPIGGGFGGVSEPGTLGLPSNPAAARSPQTEFAMDLGLSRWELQATLDGQQPIEGTGLAPMPFVAATVPLGDFGIGVSGTIPYGGGGTFPDDGAQRYHLQDGSVSFMEGSLSLAYQPIRALRVGVAGRVGRATMMKRYAVDPTGLIHSQLGEDISQLSEDERPGDGSQALDISGVGYGLAFGVSGFFSSGVEIHASYRSPVPVELTGSATVTPSQDFDLTMTGFAQAQMTYAREAALGIVVPAGPVRLIVDGGWSDWRTMERVDGSLDNIKLQTDDDSLAALLSATGTSESSLTESQRIYTDLGNTDAFYGGAAVDIPLHARWTARLGAWWAPTTIPDENFHIGIMDFPSIDLRSALAWQPSQAWLIATSLDVFMIPDRKIQNSALSLTNAPASGRVLPSANGEYSMNAARLGLTAVYRK